MEIDKFIAPDLLQDNAEFTTEENVRHNFSEQELIDLKEELFVTSKDLMVRSDALEDIKSALNSDTAEGVLVVLEKLQDLDFGDTGSKALKSEFSYTLKKINAGYEIVNKPLYAFAYRDTDGGKMAFYDEDGLYVYDRPLKATEMQLSISSNIKKIS